MKIGGLQKFSLIDYPGKVAAVIFTQGCNFCCPYCHNPELVISSNYQACLPEEEVTGFLFQRKNKLQGVVVTGGEPTLQPDLIPFLQKIKAGGFAVKLDTNGSRPDVLNKIIDEKLVDFIAMDIKGAPSNYAEIAGTDVDMKAIRKSVDLIKASPIDHLFRTTVLKPFIRPEDFRDIADMVAGSRRYVLQNFEFHHHIIDPGLLDKAHYTEEEFEELQKKWAFDKMKPETQ